MKSNTLYCNNAATRKAVTILDKRVMTKQDGRLFIDSLPRCTFRQGSLNNLPREAGEWLGM